MSFRSLASLRVAVSLSVILVFSACDGDKVEPLSQVDTINVPTAGSGSQANQNINNPTLVIPDTFPVAEGDELTLVFSEEFDGPEIDPEVWFFETGDGAEYGLLDDGDGAWGNNELQWYLPDNAMIVNGVLEITARRETASYQNYTSARINTRDRFAFRYGRIEASIKMPSGQGLWPAFWMLSQDSDYECDADGRLCDWAATGEIDIVEAINLDGTNGNEIFATIHYGGEFPANQSTSVTYTPSVDVTESFNTYALEWDADEIRWYFNGLLYATQNSWDSAALNGGPGAPFNQNFHILLNLAVGGNFPGDPNGTTPFPATMEVDWVRVYSGEDPSGVVATEPNVSAPTPTDDSASVVSLFSDSYDDIAGIDYNPNWGQGTAVTIAQIAGNQMLRYANLDFQETDFSGNPQDV
ncbi:MAG: glycoside hydrolase family 16 protein, partial [Gammaproteobacteria bacterium]|nr:glycoside hydrolase family 16 protein [Gammaproteobacteria bacterium]